MATTDSDLTIELSMAELREVTAYAVACAERVQAIFERDRPDDRRPRIALDEARRFVDGGRRTQALRVAALDAHRAARDAGELRAAAEAARAAAHAGGAAYLHPLAKATQGGHILMSAACAAHALELDAGDDHAVGAAHVAETVALAGPTVVRVLRRYPPAPSGRGRVGELWRELDASLRLAAANE
ncbi:putative immunity protein [Nocardia otitidiscaviarum]|uniref:putative immunity protein n=1 Tax=Nocardia otitidiscaviarum TaxID=1823 RepID=UPI0018957A91|nr:exonuclease SbcC [Nocardia otitidiscaviarum]MBF6180874.1 exonuclease SbcC [Nocardia otitidiscaviarum]